MCELRMKSTGQRDRDIKNKQKTQDGDAKVGQNPTSPSFPHPVRSKFSTFSTINERLPQKQLPTCLLSSRRRFTYKLEAPGAKADKHLVGLLQHMRFGSAFPTSTLDTPPNLQYWTPPTPPNTTTTTTLNKTPTKRESKHTEPLPGTM